MSRILEFEIEVTKNGIYQGINQVKRSSKARYIAVDEDHIDDALKATQGTGIGVMDENEEILKKTKRRE